MKISIGMKDYGADIHLYPGQNLFTGEKALTDKYGKLNSIEIDMLRVASGIYCTDLAVPRADRENFIRTIDLTIEVVNIHLFNSIVDELKYALNVLSNDNWNIKFKATKGEQVGELEWENKKGAVLLFSGGMDSMSGAVSFLEKNQDVILVSHNSLGNRVVEGHQTAVHAALQNHYKKTIEHIHVRAFGRTRPNYPFPDPESRENSQRTRSFLFLTLAVLVARRSNINRVVFMAENGQFAIHLPLNQARIGPFSTHTADPKFISLATLMFRKLLLNESLLVENPFLYKTKSEVFAVLPDKLKTAADLSASCWKISRTEDNKHCGVCVPCISRRIAIEHHGLKFNEYVTDLFKINVGALADDDTGKRNLIDYLEFISRFKNVTTSNKNQIRLVFPELFNDAIDVDQAIKLYARVAKQSFEVFEKYPQIKKILG